MTYQVSKVAPLRQRRHCAAGGELMFPKQRAAFLTNGIKEITLCIDCAQDFEWSADALVETGLKYADYQPEPQPIDLQAKVPAGLIKAMKLDGYIKLAYSLGWHHGRRSRSN